EAIAATAPDICGSALANAGIVIASGYRQTQAIHSLGGAGEPAVGDGQTMSGLLIIMLFCALLGALPNWPYTRNWGYGPAGIIALLLAVVIYLATRGIL